MTGKAGGAYRPRSAVPAPATAGMTPAGPRGPVQPATARHGMAAPPDADPVDWLVLTYRLPARPASLRAAVRRRLAAAGAVYLSPACAVAPLPGPAERAMRRAQAAITGAGGSAVLLTGRALPGGRDLASAVNAVLDSEYEDIIASCHDAVADIEALIAAGELHYQRLWHEGIRLRRLSGRYRAVHGQDLLGARQAQAAATALAAYRSALSEYATRVYAADAHPA